MKLLFYVRNIPNQMLPSLMVDLGYRTPPAGVCHGDSVMYAQALKTHEVKHFDERQDFIRDLLQRLASDSEKLKEHIQAARERSKAARKKTEPEDVILLELEIPGYLDSVGIAQAASEYSDVFTLYVPQERYKEYFPFIASKKMEAEQKTKIASSHVEQKKVEENTVLVDVASIFTRQQLEDDFRNLRAILRDAHENHGETVNDLPFIAYGFSGHHTIVFHYDYKEDIWILRDPNRIKLKFKTDDMPSLVMRSLFEPIHLGMSLMLDVTPAQKKQLPHLSAALSTFQKRIADRLDEMANTPADHGLTLFEYGLRNYNKKLLEQFCVLNREESLKTRGINFDFVDPSTGNTAGHFVVSWNDVDLYKTAVELGVDFSKQNALTRETVLKYAIRIKSDAVAMAIISDEAKTWSLERGMAVETDKSTALHHAALSSRPKVLEHILKLLDQQGGGKEWVAKQINLKNDKVFSTMDYAFYSRDEEIIIVLTKRLLSGADRKSKKELFQQALEHGFIKVCDMIVASLKEESKADEKLLFLQLASNSTSDAIDPLDVIIDLTEQSTGYKRKYAMRNTFSSIYSVSIDSAEEWERIFAVNNDLFIVELMKRHSHVFQNKANREKFNKFVCDNIGISPAVYLEFLRQCESQAERDSYIKYSLRASSRTFWEAMRYKQEQVALDLIDQGCNPLEGHGKKPRLDEAIEYHLPKLTEIIIDKLFEKEKRYPWAKTKSAFTKGQLNPLRKQSHYREDSLFEGVIRKGNVLQVKQLYKLMEDDLTLEDKQDILRFTCHHGNFNMFKVVLDLLSPDKKDIDKLTAHYFETLSEQLYEIQSPHPHKSLQERQKSLQNLLFMIREFHLPLTLEQKKRIFSKAEDLDFYPAKKFILNSFESDADLQKFIINCRFLRYMNDAMVINLLHAFIDDKKSLIELLFKDKNEDDEVENSIFEIAIRDSDGRALLFIDFVGDLLSEEEKKTIFLFAIKYNKGSLADKILATVPAEREIEFMGDLLDSYKKLCPDSDVAKLRNEYNFQQEIAHYFKESKNADTLKEFRTAVLTGNAEKVNGLLESLPKDKLPYYLEHRDAEGRTVLLDALLNGDEEMALNLQQKGAKKYSADRYHNTPFNEAVLWGAHKVVAAMLSASTEKLLITQGNLTTAISRKYDDIVMLFIKSNVQNDYFVKHQGDSKQEYHTTFLHEVVSNNLEKSALGFAARNDYWDLKDTKYERTPTHLAAIGGNPVILRKTIEAGADFFVKDKDGKTPADYLVSYKRYEILVELLESAKNPITLSVSDLQNLKTEFIRQIVKQALHNPELALARLQKVCDKQNVLAAVLFAKDMSAGTEMFSQSRPDAVLREITELKTFVEKIIQRREEPGFGIL